MVVNRKIYQYSYGFCEYLKVVHRELTLEKFLAKAGIGSGFGKELFSKIYDSVLAEAENLENLYERYYIREYDCFKDFIGAKFAVPQEQLEMLMNGMAESADYTLIRYNAIEYGVTGVDDLMCCDEYDEKFTKLFLLSL